jgi:hypothetical protein
MGGYRYFLPSLTLAFSLSFLWLCRHICNQSCSFYLRLFVATILGIKTPYDFKDLGYVTGIKYLDQVEDMVKASFRREKKPSFWSSFSKKEENATDSTPAKARTFGDYTLESEFTDNPRRKSSPVGQTAEEIREIVRVEEANRDAIIEDFNKDREKAQREVKALSTILTKKQKFKNSTDVLETAKMLSRMNIVLSRNLFVSSGSIGKLELYEGMSLIGNNNDPNIIGLNLNNLTAECNDRFLQTQSAMIEANAVLNNCYLALRSKEKFAGSKAARIEQRENKQLDGKFYPAGLYLKKMRKGNRVLSGLLFKEVRGGSRIAVINAVGGIGSGKSGNGVNGKSLGSDTLISQVKTYITIYLRVS